MTPLPENEERKWRYAVHEAGHCVAACHLLPHRGGSGPVLNVSIVAEPENNLRVETKLRSLFVGETNEWCVEMMAIHLGGYWADVGIGHENCVWKTYDIDFWQTEKLVDKLDVDLTERKKLWRNAWRLSRDAVDLDKVRKLAKRLVNSADGFLDGSEVDECLQD